MAYYLGIDLGTTYTAAAVWRDGRVEIANLGTRAPVIPTVVLLREDGTFLTGEAAARRAVTEPQRIAREFKRRFGDPTPIMVGGTPYSADALTARLLRWVVDSVSEREGEPPARIVMAHPANWGPFKQDLLRQVFRLADLSDVTTITEPEAAVIHYASQERVQPGAVVAVYDLGGGTFDAAVLRRTADGWEILGEPEGVERLGGVDFDQAVFHHVTTSTGDAVERLDPDDPAALAAVARLRQECVDAKEALASDVDVTIPVLLPTMQTEVRLTRNEFEAMVRPALADSISALRRALSSAHVEPEDVSAVLLVGGSSRLPLVAQLVGSELRRPVAVDAHPKHGVALGAAIVAAERGTGHSVDTEVIPTIEIMDTLAAAAPAAPAAPAGPAGPAQPVAPAASAPTVVAAPIPIQSTPAAGTPAGVPGEPAATQPIAASMAAGPPNQPGPPTLRSGPPPIPSGPRGPTGPTRPVTGNGRSGPQAPRSRPWIAIGGAIVAAALLLAAGIALGNRDDGNGNDAGDGDTSTTLASNDSTTTAAQQSTTTAGQTTTTTDAPVAAETVVLTGVEVAQNEQGNDRYKVTYTWDGFDPVIDGQAGSRHFHFFLDTTTPENAGTNGNPPGDWDLTANQGSFITKFDPALAGSAARMCTVVANGLHEVVDPESGNCVPLPN